MSRALSQALKSMRRSPYQALAATIILFITFFIGYLLTLFLIGSAQILSYFETRPQVTAYFTQDTPLETLEGYAQQLQNSVSVARVEITSQEEALEIYQAQVANDPVMQELVTADILPPSLEISPVSIDRMGEIAQTVATLEGIDEVVYRKDVVDGLRYWTTTLRGVGLGILGLFTVTSLIVILMITSMRISSKKNEIRVQRLVGATQWYIIRPFLIEGMLYGILASTFAWSVVYVALLYASPSIEAFVPEVRLVPVPVLFMLGMWGVGTGVGMLLALVASLWSGRRLLTV